MNFYSRPILKFISQTSIIKPPRNVGLTKIFFQASAQNINYQPCKTLVTTKNVYQSDNVPLLSDKIKRSMQNISTEFTEAMELMSDARDSVGTVYFSDDVTDARLQVTETLKLYNDLLENLREEQVREVTQNIGLKMEELKAQMDLIDDLAKTE